VAHHLRVSRHDRGVISKVSSFAPLLKPTLLLVSKLCPVPLSLSAISPSDLRSLATCRCPLPPKQEESNFPSVSLRPPSPLPAFPPCLRWVMKKTGTPAPMKPKAASASSGAEKIGMSSRNNATVANRIGVVSQV
jgi:hypothetical protein